MLGCSGRSAATTSWMLAAMFAEVAFFSGVINSCLEQVITPRLVLSEVVVRASCTLTTTSLVSMCL
jgi:hypothetical protein